MRDFNNSCQNRFCVINRLEWKFKGKIYLNDYLYPLHDWDLWDPKHKSSKNQSQQAMNVNMTSKTI